MSTVSVSPTISPDEFLRLPDSQGYELVEGQLLQRHMGAESSEIAARIIFILSLFLRSHRLGRIFNSEASYQCYPDDPGKFRRPDVSFVRFDRLPGGRAPKGPIRVAPDLAVEVISPGDIAEQFQEKVREYLSAGVSLVWVVYPNTRMVHVYRPHGGTAGSIASLTDKDVITGDDVLPGFSCTVREFFDDPPG